MNLLANLVFSMPCPMLWLMGSSRQWLIDQWPRRLDAYGMEKHPVGSALSTPSMIERLLSRFGWSKNDGWRRAILDSSYDAFIAIDSRGVIIDWNPQAERTFGWSREEALGRPLHETIIPPHHQRAHQKGMADFAKTGLGPVLNKRIQIDSRHRDGREIPIELIIYPVRQGQETVFGSFLHDITERKQTARYQLAQLAVTKILTDALSLNDAVSRLLEGICKNFGWRAGDFWGVQDNADELQCLSFWGDSKSLQVFEDVTRGWRFRKGRGLPGRVWETRQSVWIEDLAADPNFPRAPYAIETGLHGAIAFPIKMENEMSGVVCFYTAAPFQPEPELIALMDDLGQRLAHFISRRRAEEGLARINRELEEGVAQRTQELAEINTQLQTANRLKDEFLATVSHELRTPLNVIQGHSELLLTAEVSADERESIEAIHRNAKVQGHIINDLLDVARIISGKMQLEIASVDLVSVIHASLESVKTAAAAKSIKIDVQIAARISPVAGDANRLQQVLWNFLTNAVKFTPPEGQVTVALTREQKNMTISVTDTGKGIEPDFLPYVFERFHQEDATTTRHFGGLGLGLAIARHIVDAHGGSIQASSRGKDQGATFAVTFPQLVAEASASRPLGPEVF